MSAETGVAKRGAVEAASAPLVENDAVILGLLLCILGLVFATAQSSHPFWRRFYTIVPSLLLCYFLPSLLRLTGVVDPETSQLYFVASRYLLPTSLVLLTLSADLKGVLRLGPKAVVLFLTGTVGIVIGGPIALLVVSTVAPEAVGGAGPEAVWRGLTTVAGSWIGGSANQTAMKEVFGAGEGLFSACVAVDVLVANVWMAFLLVGASRADAIDRRTGADTTAIKKLQERIATYQASVARIPKTGDIMMVLAVGFVATAIAHFTADSVVPVLQSWNAEIRAQTGHCSIIERLSLTSGFFWIVVTATTIGVLLSFTPARRLEGVGASRLGSVLLYVLVATIGMGMDLTAVVERPELFLVGGIWMLVHAMLLIGVALLLRAPVFFLAVGSQANVGGAASAPIVASAFHPSLASVGVLLAVVGYALGTYAAWVCGLVLEVVAPAS